ncbi:MAG: hypothetical protein L6R37_006343 [Teloschistes peruensis]|nr:MAG: hypothetical protein L6R37_006343 [Teloschistes peruensis]
MDSLLSLSSPTANAIRDGRNITVPTAEIVPGDVVEMKTRDTIPADTRMIEATNFEADEALLTSLCRSSTVTRGRAQGVVFATGMRTEIGAIAAALRKKGSMMRTVKRKEDGTVKAHRYLHAWTLTGTDAVGRFPGVNVGTPLQKKLSRLAILLFCIAVVCALIVLDPSTEPFNPTAGTISFEESAPRNAGTEDAREKGRSDTLLDLLDGNSALEDHLKVASLANLTTVQKNNDNEWSTRGDPTEIAIQVFASRFDRNRLSLTSGDSPQWTSIAEFPFDSDVKKMSVVCRHTHDNHMHIFTKGAVERIVGSCTSVHWSKDGATQMTDEISEQILSNMEALASLGLRVLALASKSLEDDIDPKSDPDRNTLEVELVFRGLIGLYDPPRPESAPSTRKCAEARVAVHMLTGDHPGTARAIALDVGILSKRTYELSEDVSDAMVMTAS